ncbi:protein disulfide oxidoreductase [Ascochyta rabiei]|uniref:Protein disulfide oxidoreductase n=1 Tax=Didymella rabiei TaxID=5454 RepID=A0A163KCC4_DIDRA|nr:protein disulfide oxidoreductase [Ascochyta rabiei]
MHAILYAILGVVVILVLGPAVFADRSPIPETSGNVTKINEPAQLETVLKSNKYVVVDFYADWCPPCRAIAPVFSKLADDHAVAGQLGFAKVNVDHVKDVAKKYGISAMPTFMFFESGEPAQVKIEKHGAEEVVEMVRGANVALLRSVVQEMAKKSLSS